MVNGDAMSSVARPDSEGGDIPYYSDKSEQRDMIERHLNDMEVQTDGDLLSIENMIGKDRGVIVQDRCSFAAPMSVSPTHLIKMDIQQEGHL